MALRGRNRWRARDAVRRAHSWSVALPALAFVVALVGTRAVFAAVAPPVRTVWLNWASTSVVNLMLHPAGALAASVFVGSGDVLLWCVLGILGLITTAWRFGGWRTVLLTAAAHVTGTYLSEGLLAVRVLTHELPVEDLRIEDVGPSYVVASALAVGIAFGPTSGRVVCGAGFLGIAPALFHGLTGLDMTAVGHLCAILAGLMLAFALRRYRQWTIPSTADPTADLLQQTVHAVPLTDGPHAQGRGSPHADTLSLTRPPDRTETPNARSPR